MLGLLKRRTRRQEIKKFLFEIFGHECHGKELTMISNSNRALHTPTCQKYSDGLNSSILIHDNLPSSGHRITKYGLLDSL